MGKFNEIKEKIYKGAIKILKQPLIYVLIIVSIIQIKIYDSVPSYKIAYDSSSYIIASRNIDLSKNKIDESRTPVYPYLIKLIDYINGSKNLFLSIAIAQKGLFIITWLLFYACVYSLTKNKFIITIITLIFGIAPSIILWNLLVLTESLSLFEMTLLALLTIKYLKKPGYFKALIIGILILLMIMTRPAFIYLLPIYILFWILKILVGKGERRYSVAGLFSCIICLELVLVYCFMMKQQYGKLTITNISGLNNVQTMIRSEAYKDSDNKEMIKVVNKVLKNGGSVSRAYIVLSDIFDEKDLEEFTNSSYKSPEYPKYLLKKTIDLGSYNIGINYIDKSEKELESTNSISFKYINNLILPITFGLVYFIVIGGIVYLILHLVKKKKVDWIASFFTALILANLFTLIVGAPEEEQRLFLSSVSLVLLFISYMIDSAIKTNKNN